MIYTGPIDAYFGYSEGYLEYRSVRFENEVLDRLLFSKESCMAVSFSIPLPEKDFKAAIKETGRLINRIRLD